STPAPPPSQTRALMPLVGESGEAQEKYQVKCSRTTRDEDVTSPPKILRH
ncbi:hypothetical protein A2U01_0045384, partial [Trifolium medium]|nr:hypothetical protein [Trifolium medium]